MSFRFAHMADTHLGCNWPVIPTKEGAQIPVYGRVFEFCIDKAREYEVDFVLHAGDFVNHPRPTIPALRRSFSELRKLKADNIPFIITRGTHDSSRQYFERFGGDFLVVLEEEGKLAYVEASRKGREFFDLKLNRVTVRIYGLSDYGTDQKNRFSELSKLFSRKGADFNILLMHTGLIDRPYTLGAILSTADLRAISGLIDYFALGHDHQRFEDRENAIYNSGSIEYCSFKEASTVNYSFQDGELKARKKEVKDKGFYIVDVEDGKITAKFVKTPVRKILNVEVKFIRATPDEILNATSKVLELNSDENAILRPILSGTIAPNYQVYDIKMRDIQESVDALYVEWPTCLLEGHSTFTGGVDSERNYQPILQNYFQERRWDASSSKAIATLTTNIVEGLNPSLESPETREGAKTRVLNMIEKFDLSKVKKES